MTAPQRLATALADRYQVERELGQGGMATVYLARDLKHDREVALKVLRPELAAVLGAERFLAEIKITARLDHPHILTLIDSGAADGFLYYVLPYVRGESLRHRLVREKQLGLDESLAVTRQVASALDYAHRQGVIHRDIKPENILLQEGEAILADFGIALAVKEAGGNRLTETGLSLGTPQYMSPEQATGDRMVDARSDVYSLAAVLYEMLTGEPPVTGATAQAMIAKLMTERPTRVRAVRDTVPEGVDQAIARALSKVPADRFAGPAQFEAALTAGNAAPAQRRQSIPTAWMIGAGVVVAGAAWLAVGGRGPSARPSLLATAVPVQLTTSGNASGPLLSPDGSLVAYAESRCQTGRGCTTEVIVRELDGEGITTLYSDTVNAAPIAWSPDSRYLAYGAGTTLYIIPQRGGVPRRLSSGAEVTGGFVTPDTMVLTPLEGETHWLRTVVVASGAVTDSVLIPTAADIVYQVVPSPDGRLLLVGTWSSPSSTARLLVLDRRGRVLDSLEHADGSGWNRDGDSVVTGMVSGTPGITLVRRSVSAAGRLGSRADTIRAFAEWGILGLSPDGNTLVYSAERLGETRLLTGQRRDGRRRFERGREVATSTGETTVFISPGGRWVGMRDLIVTPDRTRERWSVEPYEGGERRVIEEVARHGAVGVDLAFAPADDHVALAIPQADGRVELWLYPLPTGAPVRVGTFSGPPSDLEWLSDGRFTMPGANGRVIRVIGRDGREDSIPVPDSLGLVQGTGRSPSVPALGVNTRLTRGGRTEVIHSRLDLDTRRFTILGRSAANLSGSNVWWDREGWMHFLGFRGRELGNQLYRLPDTGGSAEPEPVVDFEPGAQVTSLAHDGRRAVLRVQRRTSDIWLIRTPGGR